MDHMERWGSWYATRAFEIENVDPACRSEAQDFHVLLKGCPKFKSHRNRKQGILVANDMKPSGTFFEQGLGT